MAAAVAIVGAPIWYPIAKARYEEDLAYYTARCLREMEAACPLCGNTEE